MTKEEEEEEKKKHMVYIALTHNHKFSLQCYTWYFTQQVVNIFCNVESVLLISLVKNKCASLIINYMSNKQWKPQNYEFENDVTSYCRFG